MVQVTKVCMTQKIFLKQVHLFSTVCSYYWHERENKVVAIKVILIKLVIINVHCIWEKMFLQNFISSRDGGEKSTETRQR